MKVGDRVGYWQRKAGTRRSRFICGRITRMNDRFAGVRREDDCAVSVVSVELKRLKTEAEFPPFVKESV